MGRISDILYMCVFILSFGQLLANTPSKFKALLVILDLAPEIHWMIIFQQRNFRASYRQRYDGMCFSRNRWGFSRHDLWFASVVRGSVDINVMVISTFTTTSSNPSTSVLE